MLSSSFSTDSSCHSDGWKSPLRHHQRTPSIGRPPIKETLDASLSYDDLEDGCCAIRINQYNLKQEIGRGSFGAVHLAVDQSGKKYAVKEFSKSRLRKRSQSHILRAPHSGRRGGLLNPTIHRRSASDIHRENEAGNPLYLIRQEIAILKKLDHENVVNLIEVLDDPEGDSLYMVLEMCEKGVVMKVGLEETSKPYSENQCRLWFRDMILGIEYLHSQGIIHRDIKPDNLLLSADDVLKIVDFGVSEMFEKKSPMMTAKSAGSPAFLPPELCRSGHGDQSGTAVDIWSMGVTLYCLLFGHLPFNHCRVLELYNSIKHDDVKIAEHVSLDLKDLLTKILKKDPNERIKMHELRNHPWVTGSGEDMLLSAEENTANFILEPTEEETASAITSSIQNVMAVVRAVQKLKRLTLKRFRDSYEHDLRKSPTYRHTGQCISTQSMKNPQTSQESPSTIRSIHLNASTWLDDREVDKDRFPHIQIESEDKIGAMNDASMTNQLENLRIDAEKQTHEQKNIPCESSLPIHVNKFNLTYNTNIERIVPAHGDSTKGYKKTG